jgi:methionyl-tRNA formyltransferase
MKKVVIAGFGQPIIDLIIYFCNRFEIVGVVLDYDRSSKYPDFYLELKKRKIQILSFSNINKYELDAIVVINYNKIIDLNIIENIPYILNVHMGILPVYRGNFANSLSILNGNRNVGYTLHRVSEILDGGDIFYKFQYEIKEGETYFEAKTAINNDIRENLPDVIENVINGSLKGVNQENECFLYASKLQPEDGIIDNWNVDTDEIINKRIIFSRPLGTGLKMRYCNKLFEISKLNTIPKFIKSKGFPGAVILKTSDGFVWVKTKDTAVSIEELIVDGELILPSKIFKIGERL